MNIYKSSNKMISGVCSGFAEKIGFDPTIVRVFVAILCAIWPYLAIVYFVLAIIMPDRAYVEGEAESYKASSLISPNRLMLVATVSASMLSGVAIARYVFEVSVNASLTFGFALMAFGLSLIFDALTLGAPLFKSSRVFLGAACLGAGLVTSVFSFASSLFDFSRMELTAQYLGPAIVAAVFANLLFPSKRATTLIWVILLVMLVGFSIYRTF